MLRRPLSSSLVTFYPLLCTRHHDYIGGIILFDIIVNLHVGFVAHYDYKKKVVMDGKHILCYYLKWGGAWIDLLSVTPFFYEVK